MWTISRSSVYSQCYGLSFFIRSTFCANIDVVYTVGVLCWWDSCSADSGLRHRVHSHAPRIQILLLQVVQSVVRYTIGHNEKWTRGLQNSRHFAAKLCHVGGGALSAQNSIEGGLRDHDVERLVGEIKSRHVHLLPLQSRLVFVSIDHLVNHYPRDVDVGDGSVPCSTLFIWRYLNWIDITWCKVGLIILTILEHIFCKARVSAACHQDNIISFHVLVDQIANPRVSLVPIERLRVPKK